ncbi:MAG: hypothetical protein M3328_12790 [Chloroflexota bacterium]|nr:hypothetical protein [Chloroflexota bacterium]
MSRGSRGGGHVHRSAITGKYVSERYAHTHPRTTVSESAGGGGSKGGHVHRSAITGKYVSEHYAETHPRTTVTEQR